MKKLLCLLVCMIVILTGCSSNQTTADKKLVMKIESSMDEQEYQSTVTIEYNSETQKVIKGTFVYNYKNVERTDTNGSILNYLNNRYTIVDQLEGAKASIDATTNSFGLKEVWNYPDVNASDAANADDLQNNFIENGEYSLNKIKDYFEKQGYTVEEKDIK